MALASATASASPMEGPGIDPESLAPESLTDGFHLLIDALRLNGVETIYNVPGIPITDPGRYAQGEGVRVPDFTRVQSGSTCTRLLAWFGAGKEVLTRLIEECDVLVENFAPGALDRMGFARDRIRQINPRIIMASVKGFGPGRYETCKVHENVAQCAGGAASTTGFADGPSVVTGTRIGDSGAGLYLALGIVTALFQRERTGGDWPARRSGQRGNRFPSAWSGWSRLSRRIAMFDFRI